MADCPFLEIVRVLGETADVYFASASHLWQCTGSSCALALLGSSAIYKAPAAHTTATRAVDTS